jgi:hypothetical protein
MNPEIFAEWLRRQGHQVIRTPSSYWYDAGPRVYQAFPYHWLIEPEEQELRALTTRHRIAALRYSTPLEAPYGCASYHVVYTDPTYEIENLDRRSRQNIRKGLKNCRVEPITFERLAEEGWLLEKDTMDRQGRHGSQTQADWERRCQAAGDLPGFEAWGALVDDKLAASLLTFQMGDWCEMLYQECHRDHLGDRVNNALTYIVTNTMLLRPQIQAVFYALHSLDAPSSVDEFKFRMGFHARPVRQRVVFHPWLQPLAGTWSQRAANRLLQRDPGSAFLAKAEGMLRFYLQGKRPLSEQPWPECLDREAVPSPEAPQGESETAGRPAVLEIDA